MTRRITRTSVYGYGLCIEVHFMCSVLWKLSAHTKKQETWKMYFILGQASAGETPPHNALAQGKPRL